MAQVKVIMKLEGFDALQRAVTQAPDLLKAHSQSAVATTTFAAMRAAKAIVPVDTGGLRMAINSNVRGLNGRVVIEPGAFYWRFVEYGTVNMPARPFLRTAAEMESEPFIRRMREFVPKLERDLSRSRFI